MNLKTMKMQEPIRPKKSKREEETVYFFENYSMAKIPYEDLNSTGATETNPD